MANPTLPTPPTENEDPWWPTRSAFDDAVKLAVESQLAALESPNFTGIPTAPTPATADSTTKIATTAFVNAQAYAKLAGPLFTGDPRAPTPATGDNDTSIATTAFVKAQGYATLASPALTGTPTAPTPTAGDNDTSIATTAFVMAALSAGLINTALTGTPTAPTPTAGDNDTSIATTAFVTAAIAAGGGGGGVTMPFQRACPVGGTIMSSFFTSSTAATLRDRSTAPMPLLLAQNISIDQASFNLTVLAGAAGQTASIDLMSLDPATNTWTLVQNLGTAIPVATPATTGTITITFTAVALTAGVIYGFRLYEDQTYDATLRVTQGVMVGPGIGNSSGFGSGYNMPVGANTATVTAVPFIRVRRSA